MMRRPPRPHMGPPGMGPPGLGHLRPRGPPPRHLGPRGPLGTLGIPPMPGPAMGPPPGAPVPGPVSSFTNSNDPASMDSRLFVGNLNTIALNKDAVEAIFNRYGIVLGISMHKGYAFVQFSHPDEARRAGASEDGKHYAGQAIDINIVSQPKNRNALKRPSGRPVNDANVKKPRNDSPGTNQSLQRTLVTLSSGSADNKRIAASNAVKRALATVSKKSMSKPTPLVGKSSPAVTKSNVTVAPVTSGASSIPSLTSLGETKMIRTESQTITPSLLAHTPGGQVAELLEVERERLKLEREHVDVLRKLLDVERERLELEKERLAEERERSEQENKDNEVKEELGSLDDEDAVLLE